MRVRVGCGSKRESVVGLRKRRDRDTGLAIGGLRNSAQTSVVSSIYYFPIPQNCTVTLLISTNFTNVVNF